MTVGNWDQRRLGIAGLALAVVLFLALNIFSNAELHNVQADLTSNGLYTLSDGTKEVLSGLEEPITLRYFISRDLLDVSPGLGTYANRVRELIERYVDRSHGRIRLEIIDPKPFSPEEDRAVGFGMQGVPINDAGELGYFGIAGTNTTDDQDVIAFLQPQREQFLEYDLTRLVNNLAHPKKKVIGLIAGIPIDSDPAHRYKPWRVVDQMKQFFEVRSLGLDAETIKDDVDVLMIVHPFGLSDKTLYAIDQFVMNGGKTMIFVDPYAEEGARSNAAMRMPPDQGSNLEKLFKAWGIAYDRDKVLGDLGSAQRVSAGLDATGRPIITDYVAWLTLTPDRFKAEDVVTGQLRLINVASAGFIDKAKDADITFEPLITSSPASAPVDAAKVRYQPNPAEILKEFKPQDKSLTLAARIGGTLKSAFPDGPPQDKKEKEGDKTAAAKTGDKDAGKPEAYLAKSKVPANLIVVADTDILADSFWLRIQDFFGQELAMPTANNADFVINALDNLAGSSALIGLRSRGLSNRPFERVVAIQKDAEVRFRAREQTLMKQLEDVQGKLKDLQTKEKAAGGAIMSAEQHEAVEKFRREIVKVNRDLREVRRALREDIDRLDSWIKIVNIAAMPLLIALFAIGLLVVRNRRARRRHGAPPPGAPGQPRAA